VRAGLQRHSGGGRPGPRSDARVDRRLGDGQFKMNWEYDDSLVTADRHAFFKYMVKSIAKKHGLRATFMPKPFPDLTGSGCHAHVSLWKNGRNLFEDEHGDLGVSGIGYHFIGGIVLRPMHSLQSSIQP
jgi:glutamate---methylamine ligase